MRPMFFLILGLILLTDGAWFAYFRAKEKNLNSPRWFRLLAMAGGCASVYVALAGYQQIESLGFQADWAALVEPTWGKALAWSFIFAAVEEFAKMLPVLSLLAVVGRTDNPVDGLILAAVSGLGFATAESTSMWSNGHLGTVDGLARAMASPLTHALFAAPWGWALGKAWAEKRVFPIVVGLLASVSCHGAYNMLLARPGIPKMASAAIVLALWLWVLKITPPFNLGRIRLGAFTPPSLRQA